MCILYNHVGDKKERINSHSTKKKGNRKQGIKLIESNDKKKDVKPENNINSNSQDGKNRTKTLRYKINRNK